MPQLISFVEQFKQKGYESHFLLGRAILEAFVYAFKREPKLEKVLIEEPLTDPFFKYF